MQDDLRVNNQLNNSGSMQPNRINARFIVELPGPPDIDHFCEQVIL